MAFSHALPFPNRVPFDAEAELLRQACEGQTQAVERLVERYHDRLYSLALTFTRNPHEAEDLTQEAWIRILRGLNRFRGECKFSTWIYRITMNLFLSKRERCAPECDLTIDPGGPDPSLDKVIALESLRALSAEFRAVVALRYIADLSYQEIATALELPLGTVQSRLKRGLEKLRC